jgi:hypothetical protein
MPSLASSPPTSETIVAPSDEMIDKVHDASKTSLIENITALLGHLQQYVLQVRLFHIKCAIMGFMSVKIAQD